MKHVRTALSLALAGLAFAPTADAQTCSGGATTLLSQLPDYTNGFKSDSKTNAQIVAEQAVIPTGFALEAVTVWGGFGPGNNPTSDFTLIVHMDDGSGLPGAVVYSEAHVATSLVLTGTTFPPPLVPLSEYRATLTPASSVSLPAGTLWFEVYANSVGNDAWYWLTGTLDPQSGVAASSIAFTAPGATWFTLNPDMAMVVCGSSSGVGSAMCFGDGSGVSCPCFNPGGSGEGCANSTTAGALLDASGSASIGSGDAVLHGSQLVPSQPGLYFQGNNAINGGMGTPFGDGLRCCGGGVVRIQVRFANGNGLSATTVDVASEGGVAPGDTRCYQLWYRDPNGGPCGTTFNLSNAVGITWMP